MPNIKPFRTVNEYDVLNLFAYSGTLPVVAGTFVRILSGWEPGQELSELGSVGASYANTVSLRYGIAAKVGMTNLTGYSSIGMLLNDVRELDENGEKLIFKPRKAAEMQCVISGLAVPIATAGIFLYSGINGTPVAGNPAYSTGDGQLSTTPSPSSGQHAVAERVGTFLGPKSSNGFALFKLEL